jgi:hypothetical protein
VPSIGDFLLATGFAAMLDTDPTGARGRMGMKGTITVGTCGGGGESRVGPPTFTRARTLHSFTLTAFVTLRSTAVAGPRTTPTTTHDTSRLDMDFTLPQVG